MLPNHDIGKAIEGLLSGSQKRQAEAHETLVKLADEPANAEALASSLAPLASHPSPQVRGTAWIALATAQGEVALTLLESHSNDREPEARCDLAQAASLIGAPARALLAKLVRDEVFEVRFEAASGLAESGDAAAFPVLVEGLERPAMRFAALSALQILGDPRSSEPVRQFFKKAFLSASERTAAAGVLAKLGDDEAKSWLLQRVTSRKGDDRGLAIELAGELRLLSAFEPLARSLADRSDLFRGAAARALGMLGDERAFELIRAVLFDESEDEETRMDAAEGLMNLKTDEAKLFLEKAKESVRSPQVREVIEEALGILRKEGC
jgi:HEAT repeat protein